MAAQPQIYPAEEIFSERSGRTPARRKYQPTAAIDAVIAEAYRKQRQGNRRAIKNASAQLGWPSYAISKRAAEMGLVRIKEKPWATHEVQVITDFGHLSYTGIQRKLAEAGFQRSCAGIAVKVTRLRIKSNLDGYSATSLAAAFGVDAHKVLTWMRRGLLASSRRGTLRRPEQGGDSWWISREQVRRFILRYPEEIDLARVEKFWFLDIITDGKVCR